MIRREKRKRLVRPAIVYCRLAGQGRSIRYECSV